MIEKNNSEFPVRKGMFTTGIVSIFDSRKIVLFFTGRSHAGENLDALLYQRDEGLPTPLQMCDALSSNTPKEFATILIYCLIHARRNFVNVAVNFPEECEFVIDILADVYRFDAQAKEQNMTPEERLQHHQENSAPLMKKLEIWLDEQMEKEKHKGLEKSLFPALINFIFQDLAPSFLMLFRLLMVRSKITS